MHSVRTLLGKMSNEFQTLCISMWIVWAGELNENNREWNIILWRILLRSKEEARQHKGNIEWISFKATLSVFNNKIDISEEEEERENSLLILFCCWLHVNRRENVAESAHISEKFITTKTSYILIEWASSCVENLDWFHADFVEPPHVPRSLYCVQSSIIVRVSRQTKWKLPYKFISEISQHCNNYSTENDVRVELTLVLAFLPLEKAHKNVMSATLLRFSGKARKFSLDTRFQHIFFSSNPFNELKVENELWREKWGKIAITRNWYIKSSMTFHRKY